MMVQFSSVSRIIAAILFCFSAASMTMSAQPLSESLGAMTSWSADAQGLLVKTAQAHLRVIDRKSVV